MKDKRSARHDELCARLPTGVFDLAAALAAHVTRRQLQQLVVHGTVTREARGLYRLTASPSEHTHWIGARCAQLKQGAIVAHESAAAIWNLRTPFVGNGEMKRLTVLRDRETFGARTSEDIRVQPSKFEQSHITQFHGLTITTLERTALDLARNCSFERALGVIDHALQLGASRDELLRIARYMNGWPGTRVFRPALRWSDARSESSLESMARGHALASGLPVPVLQYPITSAGGRNYRADMAWTAERVVLEIDGQTKYATREDLLLEKRREDEIRAAGWTVIRMEYADVSDADRVRWQHLARALGVALQPYNKDFGMTIRWDLTEEGRSRRRRHLSPR